MKKLLLLMWLWFFIFSALAFAGPEDKVIERYKKAVGGDTTKKIASKIITGKIKQGNEVGSFLSQSTDPDRIRVNIELNSHKISECYNGNSAWRQDSTNLRTIIGTEAKTLRLEALLQNSYLRDLSRFRIAVQSLGKILVNNNQVEVVEFKLNGAYIKLMFDVKTGLLLKQERELNDGIEETFYQDYRSVNKVMEPFLIKIKRPNSELEIAVEKVEHNVRVDDKVFRYPSLDGSLPIPDIEKVMKEVMANQEQIKELRELYTFKSAETSKELDDKGQAKKTTTKVYEVTPIVGVFVERLISVDGVPLSSSEQEKEDKRVKKEIEEAKKEAKKEEKKREKNKNKDEDEEGDDVDILTFLKIVMIKDAHRDKFRDQEVLVFDFEPRKDYKPKNLAENIVSKLVGTFFIDEKAKQIVRLEARLSDSFKLGGGLLASLSSSSAFVFEQEKIRDEVWLPSYTEVNFGGRALLFVKFSQNQITQYSDYRRYQTSVEVKADDDSTEEQK
ncbi:MAG: hypothetical protein HY819_23590 [Acidobacteria bacterium]|nr:hypothetical protein [Acidobacteriota bacterium]